MARHTGFGSRRRQRRQRLIGILVRVVGIGGLLILFAFSGYEVGTSQQATEIERLEQDLADLHEDNRALTERTAIAEEEAKRLDSMLQRLRAEYAANVPDQEVKQLVELIEDKLVSGVGRERLAFVISQTGHERQCEDEVETRRLLARTPISTDVQNTVTFADNRISVSGEGRSDRSEGGLAQAWFDPVGPVTLRFFSIDGDVKSVEDVLPLTTTVVLDDKEYFFAATAGERRGMLLVTAQECEYP